MHRLVLILRALWATEPARVVAAVVTVLAVAGLRVNDADVLAVLTVVLPIILGAEATRRRVTPWTGDPTVASDTLLGDDPR